MSLESKIEALTVAVTQLTNTILSQQPMQAVPAPQAAPAPAPFAPPAAAPTPAPAAAAPVMPPPPSFMAPPAPAAAAPTAPFSDSNGMIKYLTDTYMVLGESKGPALQNVINSLGHSAANEIRPDQYGQLYALIEQLKAS